MPNHKKDLVGQRFGELLVLEISEKGSNGAYRWKCQCNCGNIIIVSGTALRSDQTTSCGRMNLEVHPSLHRKYEKDLTGQKFGRLTVIAPIHSDEYQQDYYQCICDCGKKVVIRGYSLIYKSTVSCGCYRKEVISKRRLSDLDASINKALIAYKSGARKRNFEFNLTMEEFVDLVTANCFYCGTSPSRDYSRNNRPDGFLNGIDRLDSTKSYHIENCVSCCTVCNRAKLTTSKEDFINWINKVYTNLVSRGEIST